MGRGFNIEYLRAPELSKGAGTAAAVAAIGDSLMKLGQIGINRQKIDDEKQRHLEENKFNQTKLDWERQKHKADSEQKRHEFNQNLLMKEKELEAQIAGNAKKDEYYAALTKELERKRIRQEAEDKANVAIYKEIFPEQSKNKSDEEILALGKVMQNFKNNKKSGTEGLVRVDSKFYNEYAHLGVVRSTKEGFFADKSFIDELVREADARSEARGGQAGYKDRAEGLKKSKPLIFGDDGAM